MLLSLLLFYTKTYLMKMNFKVMLNMRKEYFGRIKKKVLFYDKIEKLTLNKTDRSWSFTFSLSGDAIWAEGVFDGWTAREGNQTKNSSKFRLDKVTLR
jgi:hypothetical protein